MGEGVDERKSKERGIKMSTNVVVGTAESIASGMVGLA